MSRVYKVRVQPGSRGGVPTYQVTIPAEIGRAMVERDLSLRLEPTEEGLLYRPVPAMDSNDEQELPSWLR